MHVVLPKTEKFVDAVWQQKPIRAKFVGDYLIGDVLGEGSFARVKEALDRRTLERRAVKIMKFKKLRKMLGGVENVDKETGLLR